MIVVSFAWLCRLFEKSYRFVGDTADRWKLVASHSPAAVRAWTAAGEHPRWQKTKRTISVSYSSKIMKTASRKDHAMKAPFTIQCQRDSKSIVLGKPRTKP